MMSHLMSRVSIFIQPLRRTMQMLAIRNSKRGLHFVEVKIQAN